MPDSQEVTLKQWAKEHRVPLRTAQEWRKNGKIPARRVRSKRELKLVRTVTEYLVRIDVTPPFDAS